MQRSFRASLAVAVFALGAGGATAQDSTIDSLTGSVTSNEIASFKAVIPTLVPGDSNTHNNNIG